MEPTHDVGGERFELPQTVVQGTRNDTLFKYACSLQAKGVSDSEILRLVGEANRDRCTTPLSDGEIQTIVNQGTNYKKGSSRTFSQRRQEARGALELPVSVDDRALSKLFGERYRDRLRWVPEARCWYCYDGTRWANGGSGGNELAEGMMKEFVGDLCVAAARCEDDARRAACMKAVARYNDSTKRRNLLRDSHSELITHIQEFDTDLSLVNCKNLTVELGAPVKTHAHRPEDMITKVAGCDYDPQAGYGEWNKFLRETFKGREAVIPFFQQRMGMALGGDTSRDCFYLAIGPTRTGKSTTVNTIKNVFGEYKTTADAATFTQSARRAQNASPDYACLRGARLVDVPELSESMVLDIALVKRITGGDELTGRALRQDPITFTPTCTIVMPTNFKPRMTDETLFTSRRVVILPFYNARKPQDQDHGLEKKMCEPKFASSVLNWLIDGYASSTASEAPVPEVCNELAEEYSRDEDIIGAFIEDECVEVEGKREDGSVIYARYSSWCKDNGYQPCSAGNFYKRLSRRGYACKRDRVTTGTGSKVVRNCIHGLVLAN